MLIRGSALSYLLPSASPGLTNSDVTVDLIVRISRPLKVM